MVIYFIMLIASSYGYAELEIWIALVVFGASISGIVICEIRFQFDRLKEAEHGT